MWNQNYYEGNRVVYSIDNNKKYSIIENMINIKADSFTAHQQGTICSLKEAKLSTRSLSVKTGKFPILHILAVGPCQPYLEEYWFIESERCVMFKWDSLKLLTLSSLGESIIFHSVLLLHLASLRIPSWA